MPSPRSREAGEKGPLRRGVIAGRVGYQRRCTQSTSLLTEPQPRCDGGNKQSHGGTVNDEIVPRLAAKQNSAARRAGEAARQLNQHARAAMGPSMPGQLSRGADLGGQGMLAVPLRARRRALVLGLTRYRSHAGIRAACPGGPVPCIGGREPTGEKVVPARPWQGSWQQGQRIWAGPGGGEGGRGIKRAAHRGPDWPSAPPSAVRAACESASGRRQLERQRRFRSWREAFLAGWRAGGRAPRPAARGRQGQEPLSVCCTSHVVAAQPAQAQGRRPMCAALICTRRGTSSNLIVAAVAAAAAGGPGACEPKGKERARKRPGVPGRRTVQGCHAQLAFPWPCHLASTTTDGRAELAPKRPGGPARGRGPKDPMPPCGGGGRAGTGVCRAVGELRHGEETWREPGGREPGAGRPTGRPQLVRVALCRALLDSICSARARISCWGGAVALASGPSGGGGGQRASGDVGRQRRPAGAARQHRHRHGVSCVPSARRRVDWTGQGRRSRAARALGCCKVRG